MRQEQYIRYIFDFLIAVVIYLFSMLMIKSLYDIQVNSLILFIMVLQIVIYRQFIAKLKNNTFLIFAMIISAILISIAIQGKENIIGNILLLGGQGVLINYFDTKPISKEYYFNILKVILVVLILSTLFHVGIPKELLAAVNKIYILILLLSVILLRCTRNVENAIKEKDEKIKIVGLVALILIICNEKVYEFIFNIGRVIFVNIVKVASFALGIIIYPMARLLLGGVKHLPLVNQIEEQSGGGNGVSEGVVETHTLISSQAASIIEVLLIIAIIIAIYFLIVKFKSNNKYESDENGEIIIREKLEHSVKTGKSTKNNRYKGTDNRTIIKKVFFDIQYRVSKKSLFSEADTATEIISKIKDTDNSISKTYNKAKFSNIPITDAEVESVKEEYSRIKSEIKEISKKTV